MPKLIFFPSEIITFLQFNNIPCKFISSEDDMTDDEIEINENLHIQCTETREYCVVQQKGEIFTHFPLRSQPSELLVDILLIQNPK
jgi:hypothetical protein